MFVKNKSQISIISYIFYAHHRNDDKIDSVEIVREPINEKLSNYRKFEIWNYLNIHISKLKSSIYFEYWKGVDRARF